MSENARGYDEADLDARKDVEREINAQVAANLRLIAERSALSYADLARHIGISRMTLNKVFQVKSSLSPGRLKLAADFFDVPITDFFEETEFMA